MSKWPKKGVALIESTDTVVFSDVRVTGLATLYANLYVYTDSRVIEIECIDSVDKSPIRYPLLLPSDILDYAFNDALLSVEIRGGDGRRLRAFDSEWWPLTFTSRYDYERMTALICYFCSRKKVEKESPYTTDFTYTINPSIVTLDDAPLLKNVIVEQFEFGDRLSCHEIYDIQFTDNPIQHMHNEDGGYWGIKNNEVILRRCFSKLLKNTFSISIGEDEYKIKTEDVSGSSETLEFVSQQERDIALQCFDLMFGSSRGVEGTQGGISCPVCKKSTLYTDSCPNCGFENLAPTFVSKSDAEDWMANTVIPYREKWMDR